MAVIQNKLNRSAVVHLTANASLTVAGNSSVSNLAIGSETLTGCVITQVWYGSPSGNAAHWVIKRGANTVLVLDGTGHVSYSATGSAIDIDPTATLVANLNGTTTGYLMIEVKKLGVGTTYVIGGGT